MPEMAMPTARAIRPDKYRDPALLLPTHFVLGVYPDYTLGLLSYCISSAAATHIVQATHTPFSVATEMIWLA